MRKQQLKRHPKPPVRQRPSVLWVAGWYTPNLHRGFARYAKEVGWALDSRSIHHRDIGMVSNWRGEGVLLTGMPGRHPEEWAFALSTGVPVVSATDPGGSDSGSVPVVYADYRSEGRMAAEHLIERGFVNLVFVGYHGVVRLQRLAGARQAIERAGLVLREVFVGEAMTDEDAVRADLQARLTALPRPLGVIAYSDEVGVEVANICIASDLLVPEEVAIVAIDNDDLVCDCAPVPLSSVDTDMEGRAYRAAQVLDDLMHGSAPPAGPVIVPPTGVVARQSTDVQAVEHPAVAAAMRHIRNHYQGRQLSVQAVASESAISVHGLNDAFHKYVGCTVGELIRRTRLNHATDLLRRTNLTVATVAELCGYREAEHLRATLRRETGLSPRAWRKKHRKRDGSLEP